jgi:hypothetical protein
MGSTSSSPPAARPRVTPRARRRCGRSYTTLPLGRQTTARPGAKPSARDGIASDIGSAVDSAGRALADGLTLAQWAQAETDGASCHAVVDPYDLREALLTAVRERPEWLLGKDGRTPIDGAALLAADAGVDIPTV